MHTMGEGVQARYIGIIHLVVAGCMYCSAPSKDLSVPVLESSIATDPDGDVD